MSNPFRQERRSRSEIYMDMVRVAFEPIKPTQMMYASNMSWKAFQASLKILIDLGYVEETIISTDKHVRDKCYYTATDKGKEFIRDMDKYKEIGFSSTLPEILLQMTYRKYRTLPTNNKS